jgi:hypothetical protein
MSTKDSRRPRLSETLKQRFAVIIEEDTETEGFWMDVAKHYGLEDQSLLTDKQCEIAQRCASDAARRLRR